MPALSASHEPAELALEHRLQWEKNARLPLEVAAVFSALRFSGGSFQALAGLADGDWKKALKFTGDAGLTLIVGATCREHLPDWLNQQLARDTARNAERLRRLRAALVEVSARLADQGVEYLVLKGFAQQAGYVPDPSVRIFHDNDLFIPPGSLESAHRAILSLSYEPIEDSAHPADHLAPLTRKTGWVWRGDAFDPEIPPWFELHFQFWDAETECIAAPGVEDFWARRVEQDGLPMLHPADRLAYAALHLLRHLFRGSVRAGHVYQVAYFLENHAEDEAFWRTWRALHSQGLRRLEAVAFRLALEWFGGRVSAEAGEEMERLDGDIPLWFEKYAATPAEGWFHPNKHELWLHLAMVDAARDRRTVFIRRVFPSELPAPRSAVCVPEEQKTIGMRWRERIEYTAHVASRVVHHARVLPVTLWHGFQWKWRASRLEAPFWQFILAQSFLSIGLFLFYLLYNLYLLDRGYREDALGSITSAVTLGCVAGMLPSASIIRRYGLKRALEICFVATPVAFALRSVLSGTPALLATAFAGGFFFSLFAVCMSPAVAALTSERTRAKGFSVLTSTGIGMGLVSSLIGARVPGWILHAGLASDALHAKQLTLFIACGIAGLGLWPLARLRLESPAAEPKSPSYPLNPFMRRFLLSVGIAGLGLGAFDPFFNAYLSRQFHLPVERIGLVFSLSQGLQVIAVLLSPFLLRRLGLVRGVASMQLASAVAVAALASVPVAALAALLYALHTSFQYMDDPGVYTLVMNQVSSAQRGGASALQYLVAFTAQAISAAVSGWVLARFGYPPVLASAAILGATAALLFWRLLRKFDQGKIQSP